MKTFSPPIIPPALLARIMAQAQVSVPQSAAIYQPGGVTGGKVLATSQEVAAFIVQQDGCCIVYVDDSIVSPAPLDAGVTWDGKGRLELRPAQNGSNFSVLQIEDGAQLKDVSRIRGTIQVQGDCRTAAKPSLAFSRPDFVFFLDESAVLTNTAGATQPIIKCVPGGTPLILAHNFTEIDVTAGGAALVSVPATATLFLIAFASTIGAGIVAGAGDFTFEYDGSTLSFSTPPGTPAAQPGVTGVYTKTRDDTLGPVPTILGSRGGNAALANLLTALAALDIIIDGTGP